MSRTNEELADALDELKRIYFQTGKRLPGRWQGERNSLDEAAARLRESEGERIIQGWRIEKRTTGHAPGKWEYDRIVSHTGSKPNFPPSPNGAYEYRSRALILHAPQEKNDG